VSRFVWLILPILAVSAFAQEKLTATVDRTTLRVGESLTLTLTFEGSASGVSEPKVPPLEKLQVAGGPFTSTSFTIVNGRASSTASFSYILRAKEAGQGMIGPAKVVFRNKELASNSINVTILTASASAPGAGKDMKGGAADVFIRVTPDRTTAYVGEQITLTYKLYFARQIASPEIARLPRATGFWVEEISAPQQLTLTDEVINGRPYKAAVLRKLALFPTGPGELDVEPMVINTKVETQSRRRSLDPFDIFNDPFFQLGRQFEAVELESPTVRLNAKPLPQTGVPIDYDGAVGSFEMRTVLDRQTCKTDEAVTFTIEIEGTGNIKTLAEPRVSIPPDIQRFDPESSEDIRRNQAKVAGKKTFKYVLIPRAPGLQEIPEIHYSFFDPERGKYQTITGGPLRLQVEKGSGGGMLPSGIAVASKQGVENIATDIAFAKTQAGSFTIPGRAPHRGIIFWMGAAAPWAALLSIVATARIQRKMSGQQRRRDLLRAAFKETQAAEKALKTGHIEQAAQHAAVALDSMAESAVGQPCAALTPMELEDIWRSQQLDTELLQMIRDVQDECDRARFASGTFSRESAGQLVRKVKTVYAGIERLLGKGLL